MGIYKCYWEERKLKLTADRKENRIIAELPDRMAELPYAVCPEACEGE